jgi:hypothetical protein
MCEGPYESIDVLLLDSFQQKFSNIYKKLVAAPFCEEDLGKKKQKFESFYSSLVLAKYSSNCLFE